MGGGGGGGGGGKVAPGARESEEGGEGVLDMTIHSSMFLGQCDGVSYAIVSFLIPNPQHTLSLYNFISSRITAHHIVRKVAIDGIQRNI